MIWRPSFAATRSAAGLFDEEARIRRLRGVADAPDAMAVLVLALVGLLTVTLLAVAPLIVGASSRGETMPIKTRTPDPSPPLAAPLIDAPVGITPEISRMQQDAGGIIVAAKVLIISSDRDLDQAAELLKGAKRIFRALEEKRKDLKAPILEAGRRVDQMFEPILGPLKQVEIVIKAAIGKFELAREAEAARRQREAEELARARLAAAATELGADPSEVVQTVVVAPSFATPPPLGISTRDRWVYDVVQLAAVPSQFVQVNDVAVRQAIADGVREIPGLSIRAEKTVVVRA